MTALTTIAAVAIAGTIVLALVRVLRGPRATDRVVGLDLIAYAVVGALALRFVTTQQAGLIDGALLISAISFLGTVALARALEAAASGAHGGPPQPFAARSREEARRG